MRLAGTAIRPPYGLLSLLLDYPTAELMQARPAITDAVSQLPNSPDRKRLLRFVSFYDGAAVLDLQRHYVETFDLQRGTSLYLTYYTHGETRKRGLALLRLKRLYAACGLYLLDRELPDYLPLMLAFAESVDQARARQVLAEHVCALELLRSELERAGSPYADLVKVSCSGLPRLGLADLETVAALARQGPTVETVGIQPFAPSVITPVRGVRI